jgi:hypothetical protein
LGVLDCRQGSPCRVVVDVPHVHVRSVLASNCTESIGRNDVDTC